MVPLMNQNHPINRNPSPNLNRAPETGGSGWFKIFRSLNVLAPRELVLNDMPTTTKKSTPAKKSAKRATAKKTTKKAPAKKVAKKAAKKSPAKKTTAKKTTSKDAGKKDLVFAPDHESFWVSDGQVLNSLLALRDAFSEMDKQVYLYHAEGEANDFSNWVGVVLCDEKCAKDLQKAKTPSSAKTVVVRHLKMYAV